MFTCMDILSDWSLETSHGYEGCKPPKVVTMDSSQWYIPIHAPRLHMDLLWLSTSLFRPVDSRYNMRLGAQPGDLVHVDFGDTVENKTSCLHLFAIYFAIYFYLLFASMCYLLLFTDISGPGEFVVFFL